MQLWGAEGGYFFGIILSSSSIMIFFVFIFISFLLLLHLLLLHGRLLLLLPGDSACRIQPFIPCRVPRRPTDCIA